MAVHIYNNNNWIPHPPTIASGSQYAVSLSLFGEELTFNVEIVYILELSPA